MNTVTEKYHVGYYFQSKTSTPIPCPVDRDDIVSLMFIVVVLSLILDAVITLIIYSTNVFVASICIIVARAQMNLRFGAVFVRYFINRH